MGRSGARDVERCGRRGERRRDGSKASARQGTYLVLSSLRQFDKWFAEGSWYTMRLRAVEVLRVDLPADNLRLRLFSGSTNVETESSEISDASVAMVSTDERRERR